MVELPNVILSSLLKCRSSFLVTGQVPDGIRSFLLARFCLRSQTSWLVTCVARVTSQDSHEDLL